MSLRDDGAYWRERAEEVLAERADERSAIPPSISRDLATRQPPRRPPRHPSLTKEKPRCWRAGLGSILLAGLLGKGSPGASYSDANGGSIGIS